MIDHGTGALLEKHNRVNRVRVRDISAEGSAAVGRRIGLGAPGRASYLGVFAGATTLRACLQPQATHTPARGQRSARLAVKRAGSPVGLPTPGCFGGLENREEVIAKPAAYLARGAA